MRNVLAGGQTTHSHPTLIGARVSDNMVENPVVWVGARGDQPSATKLRVHGSDDLTTPPRPSSKEVSHEDVFDVVEHRHPEIAWVDAGVIGTETRFAAARLAHRPPQVATDKSDHGQR